MKKYPILTPQEFLDAYVDTALPKRISLTGAVENYRQFPLNQISLVEFDLVKSGLGLKGYLNWKNKFDEANGEFKRVGLDYKLVVPLLTSFESGRIPFGKSTKELTTNFYLLQGPGEDHKITVGEGFKQETLVYKPRKMILSEIILDGQRFKCNSFNEMLYTSLGNVDPFVMKETNF